MQASKGYMQGAYCIMQETWRGFPSIRFPANDQTIISQHNTATTLLALKLQTPMVESFFARI